MSSIRLCTAPGTWGVEPVVDPDQAPWQLVLDEVAAAGFDGIELGPYGYLPVSPDDLNHELSQRGLGLAGGFVMEPFHDANETERILSFTRGTCELLDAGGAKTLVVIAGLVPERSATAGRPEAAPVLEGADRETFLETVSAIVDIAVGNGLKPGFHPHAGTYVEFGPEVDQILQEVGSSLGLCVDTGHSVYSSIDPYELLMRHRDRVVHVHFKDLHRDLLAMAIERKMTFEEAVGWDVFCALGDGTVDLTKFVDGLREIGYAGWATYEQDRVATEYPRARPDAERSLAYLHTIGIQNRSEAA